ncbi:CAP domain-containing protein [Nocardioides daeguensis]|uniref:SCP domain-containing protein n=1 Tax=Nocardioides daeguensis TaxID=908359 RepID=A0ABP6WDP6_9ACTN|nr:CAP domain-containing protein [Nocardioides daeguensis]MBV6728057.1 CAP domain-containing protein [Nocardioides daeguensis]MCR1774131.1 CAP domain-containing protein [Nocardioides daeguensis]
MRAPVRAGLAQLAVAAALLATCPVPTHATASRAEAGDRGLRAMGESYESAVLQALERRRERRGLRGLVPSACVDALAEARSRRMAVRDEMVHYPGLSKVFGRCGGARVGEIIARGRGFRDPAVVVRAWMESPTHHEVIVRPSYRQAAVGAWRDEHGTVFVSVIFRAP